MHGMVWVYLSQRQPTSNQFPTSKAFLGLVRRRSVPPQASASRSVVQNNRRRPSSQALGLRLGRLKNDEDRTTCAAVRRAPARARAQALARTPRCAVRSVRRAVWGVGAFPDSSHNDFACLALAPGTLKYGFSVLKTFFNLYRRPSISNRSTPPATCPSSRSSGARRSLAAWPRRSTWRRAAGGAAGSRVCPAAPAA